MTLQLPYTLSNGTTPDADEVTANLQTLRDKLGLVRNADIIANAGIDKSKLSQRSASPPIVVILFPFGQSADWAATPPTPYTLPAALTVMSRFRVSVASGQRAYLGVVEWCPEDVTIGGADYPQVDVQVDGVTIGQAVTLDTDAAYFRIANANPLTSPLYPLNDNSVVTLRVGKTGAGAASIRGLSVRLQLVTELV